MLKTDWTLQGKGKERPTFLRIYKHTYIHISSRTYIYTVLFFSFSSSFPATRFNRASSSGILNNRHFDCVVDELLKPRIDYLPASCALCELRFRKNIHRTKRSADRKATYILYQQDDSSIYYCRPIISLLLYL